MQAVPITTKAVSLNPAHGEVYSIQNYVIGRWFSPDTPVSPTKKKTWPPRYNWNIVESGVCNLALFKIKFWLFQLDTNYQLNDWLIDDCLTSNEHDFSFIQDENKFNNYSKIIIQKRGKNYVNSGDDFWLVCHQKIMHWFQKCLVICSGYNTPTLFRNLQE